MGHGHRPVRGEHGALGITDKPANIDEPTSYAKRLLWMGRPAMDLAIEEQRLNVARIAVYDGSISESLGHGWLEEAVIGRF